MGAEPRLTRRAKEVAELVALGLTNREIADRLFLSERTIEWHVEQIFNKFGFTSRSQIAAWVGRSLLDTSVQAPGSRPRGNLPAQLTSFVGREHELRTLLDLVTANRLVTLTGPGGVGKTRVALRLAEELQPDFQHGAWLCDLAPVSDPTLVGDAAAQALGVKHSAGDRLAAAREHLRSRSSLLLLDNCEHLLGSAAALARDLLAACPRVRIIATSRRPLGVIGEAVCSVEPMPQSDAMDLFRSRAETAVPNFRFGHRNADPISALCRSLEGVPLAIELVVPRLRVQSAEELAIAVLDPAWQLRTKDRHGSLHAIADWSYRLLNSDEQGVFCRLGVFSGWFDGQDAAGIAPGARTPVPVLLGSLVEQSMLVQEHASGITRYRLLEILKAFALERLEESGDLEACRLDHAEHMVRLAERVDVLLDEGSAYLRPKVATLVDDVRAALITLLRVRPEQAGWLSACMMPTWRITGRAQEGLTWSERTLAANQNPSPDRCWNLFHHAATLALLRRAREAEAYLREAEAFADLPGNEDLRRRTLNVRAFCKYAQGDFPAAVRLLGQGIVDFEQQGDKHGLAYALNLSAMSLLFAGQPHEALIHGQRSVDIRRQVDPSRLQESLDTLAQAHVLTGDVDRARTCWLEAAELCIDTNWDVSGVLFGLALVTGLQGKKEAALRFHFVAERIFADVNQSYCDPVAKLEAQLMSRLSSEVGQEVVKHLRSQSEALEPSTLLQPAQAES